MYPKYKAAICHAAPVFLDKQRTVEKAISLIRECARNGAELVAFPEVYLAGYPVWLALWSPLYTHDLFKRLVEQSVRLDGPEIAAIRQAAREAGVFVSMGLNEKSPISAGGLWNTNLLISDEGRILNHHRKLVPTNYERLIWASGDGAGLRVADTRLGMLGALICGENTNPLARFTLMAQGEQVHISTWPSGGLHPTHLPTTGDNYDMTAAVKIRAFAHSFEAKVYGIVVSGFTDKAARDFLVARDAGVAEILDRSPRALSLFISPTGEQLGAALQEEEGILYQEIDLEKLVEPKQMHDVVGYYNRFDIFELRVNRRRLVPITFTEPGQPGTGPDDALAAEPAEGTPVLPPLRGIDR